MEEQITFMGTQEIPSSLVFSQISNQTFSVIPFFLSKYVYVTSWYEYILIKYSSHE